MTFSHSSDKTTTSEPEANQASYGRLVLVEDDVALSDLTRQYLTREGFEVQTVADGLQAPDRIQAWAPDLVILDIMLPGQDGLEVCRQIQRFYQGPILFLTARGESLDEILGLELGADDYLTKPVDFLQLEQAITGKAQNGTAADTAVLLSPEQLEWEHIHRVLAEHGGNISRTAELLGMHRRTLQRKLSKHRP